MKFIALTIVLFSVSMAPAFAQLDHSPRWVEGTLRYGPDGLPGENTPDQYVNEFEPATYILQRFGNRLDDSGSGANRQMSFNIDMTNGPFSNDVDDLPGSARLFLFRENNNDLTRLFFADKNADWSQPGSVSLNLSAGSNRLMRYFTFEPSNLDGLDDSTKRYVIMIHGWNPSSNADQYHTNFPELTVQLENYFENRGMADDWRVLRYRMERDTDTGPIGTSAAVHATRAAESARLHGYYLARLILAESPDVERVHLIAHSAGSWAARSALQYLTENATAQDFKAQMTLLDAFMPNSIFLISSNLGVAEMNLARYFTTNGRLFGLDSYYDNSYLFGTNSTYDWGEQALLPTLRVDNFGVEEYQGHDGPIAFYSDSIKALNLDMDFPFPGGWSLSLAASERILETAPVTIAPTAGIIEDDRRPVFSWLALNHADRYQLRIEIVDGPVFDSPWIQGPSTSWQPTVDLPLENYTWSVAGWNREHGFGPWSEEIEFTIAQAPAITSQPTNQNVIASGSATFMVVATGSDPLSYQWFKGEDSIPGANSPTLTFSPVTGDDVGTYTVEVSNDFGSVISAEAVLAIHADAYQAWLADYPELDPTEYDRLDNPAGDGVPNLLKFAFGLSPVDRLSERPWVLEQVTEGSVTHLLFRFHQRTGGTGQAGLGYEADDLVYWVEVSGDLVTWHRGETHVAEQGDRVPSQDGVTEEVTVRVLTPIDELTRQFVRLLVVWDGEE